jgi:hypothetical protein
MPPGAPAPGGIILRKRWPAAFQVLAKSGGKAVFFAKIDKNAQRVLHFVLKWCF